MFRTVGVTMPMLIVILMTSLFFIGNEPGCFSNMLKKADCLSSQLNVFDSSRKSLLRKDEFFRKSPTDEDLRAYFDFAPSLYPNKAIGLQPIWSCVKKMNESFVPVNNSFVDRETKLVFVHISRSAGYTIRALLRGYSSFCNAGITLVNQCADLGIEFMSGNDSWSNGKGSHAAGRTCWLASAVPRGEARQLLEVSTPSLSTSSLTDMNIDIVAGSVPIGCLDKLHNNEGKPSNVMYIVFFRDPLSLLVSELLSKMKQIRGGPNFSVDEAVSQISLFVDERMKSKYNSLRYYEKYSNYLLTPTQKAWVEREGVDWTPERRVNLTLRNLYDRNVLVGIVDNMSQSLSIISFALDKTDKAEKLFRFFSSEETLSKVTNHLISKKLTETVIRQILLDDKLSIKMDEYLQYAKVIYDHALQIHANQLETVNSSKTHDW